MKPKYASRGFYVVISVVRVIVGVVFASVVAFFLLILYVIMFYCVKAKRRKVIARFL